MPENHCVFVLPFSIHFQVTTNNTRNCPLKSMQKALITVALRIKLSKICQNRDHMAVYILFNSNRFKISLPPDDPRIWGGRPIGSLLLLGVLLHKGTKYNITIHLGLRHIIRYEHLKKHSFSSIWNVHSHTFLGIGHTHTRWGNTILQTKNHSNPSESCPKTGCTWE
jgi:hypothetical protein